jgi:polyphosphate kinase
MFHNNGEPEIYMGSADWMSRNLHSRIEVIFPIYDEQLKTQIKDILQLQLRDTKKAVLFRADISNEKILTVSGKPIASQDATYEYVRSLGEK